jgi:hypothetical protein
MRISSVVGMPRDSPTPTASMTCAYTALQDKTFVQQSQVCTYHVADSLLAAAASAAHLPLLLTLFILL